MAEYPTPAIETIEPEEEAPRQSLKEKIHIIKLHLNSIFNEDEHELKWHYIVDYVIICMIVLSSAEIFLSTFDLHPTLKTIMMWVDGITLVFFTMEVTLRIWVAPMAHKKMPGWKARCKYMFSFNGMIDMISTYPFYLQWILPFPISWMKMLRMGRTVRIFRITRYTKSWTLLKQAVYEKKNELIISMQFLFIITFILSLLLFFCEHDAQPDVYNDGFSTVAWSFAQYIGDPGRFGDTPPITGFGKTIACIVGLLGIAMVAVPASILGNGFTEAIAKDNLSINREKLSNCFEEQLDRPTNIYIPRPCLSSATILARQGLTDVDVSDVVKNTKGFRIINLADTQPIDEIAVDCIAVERYEFSEDCNYGCFIDRKSNITIISPASMYDPIVSYFTYYLAKFGNFNLISREFGKKVPYKNFYLYNKDILSEEAAQEYFADVERLVNRPNSWSFTFMATSGASEPKYDEHLHFLTGNPIDNPGIGEFVFDKTKFELFYKSLTDELKREMDFDCDMGIHHDSQNSEIFLRHLNLKEQSNNVIVRISWEAMLRSPYRIMLIQTLARLMKEFFLNTEVNYDLYEEELNKKKKKRVKQFLQQTSSQATDILTGKPFRGN